MPVAPAFDAAARAHFVEHGWVGLPGCVDRATREAWIAQALAGIRAAPWRHVKECLPGDRGPDLHGYDPWQPASWRRPLLTFRGDRTVAVADFSPRLWQAICELLGGETRVATRVWSNYLIFGHGPRRRPWWYRYQAPSGAHGSWHVDDPSPQARLDTWRTGLLVLLRFSDVPAQGGGTFIAPESLRELGRRLRAHPAGYDLARPTLGAEIARACTRFVELQGAAGDAVLVHPWMLHAPSPTPPGRVRILANPLVYLQQPWQLAGPGERTLLEQATLRALEP